MVNSQIEIRTFEDSTPDKLIVYNVNGANYSEALVKLVLMQAISKHDDDVLKRGVVNA